MRKEEREDISDHYSPGEIKPLSSTLPAYSGSYQDISESSSGANNSGVSENASCVMVETKVEGSYIEYQHFFHAVIQYGPRRYACQWEMM